MGRHDEMKKEMMHLEKRLIKTDLHLVSSGLGYFQLFQLLDIQGVATNLHKYPFIECLQIIPKYHFLFHYCKLNLLNKKINMLELQREVL